jgi:hypothetical protein
MKEILVGYTKIGLKSSDCGQTLFFELRTKQSLLSLQLTTIMLALVLLLQTRLERSLA